MITAGTCIGTTQQTKYTACSAYIRPRSLRRMEQARREDMRGEGEGSGLGGQPACQDVSLM